LNAPSHPFQLICAVMNSTGKNVEDDNPGHVKQGRDVEETTTMNTLRESAVSGLADAQYRLGMSYEKGNGVEKNMLEAMRLYRLAADQNHTSAQYQLGKCFEFGSGVTPNHEEASRLYHVAAEAGDAEAQCKLGMYYQSGYLGLSRSMKDSARWFHLAANQGYAEAQHRLAELYGRGLDVPQDWEASCKWYRLAAQQGHADAQYKLSECFQNGSGVQRDIEEAARWRLLADALKPRKIVRRDKVAYAMYAIDLSEWSGRSFSRSKSFVLDTMTVLEHEVCVTVSSNAAARVRVMCEEHGWEKEIIVTVCCNYFGDSRDLSGMALTPTVFFEPAGVVFSENTESCFNSDSGEFQGISVSLTSHVDAEGLAQRPLGELHGMCTVLTTTQQFQDARVRYASSPADVPFDLSHWKVSPEDLNLEQLTSRTPKETDSYSKVFNKHKLKIIKARNNDGLEERRIVFKIKLLHFTGEVVVALAVGMIAGSMLTTLSRNWSSAWRNNPDTPLTDLCAMDAVTLSPRIIMSEIFKKHGSHYDPEDTATVVRKIIARVEAIKETNREKHFRYDCFLSYRIFPDTGIVETLYGLLRANGLHNVFFAKHSLIEGRDWKSAFLQGLVNSMLFIPIVSSDALADARSNTKDHSGDNVLLEYQTALHIAERTGNEEFIYPVFLGKYQDERRTVLVKFNEFNTALYADCIHPTE
jgi:TPR repeat protein